MLVLPASRPSCRVRRAAARAALAALVALALLAAAPALAARPSPDELAAYADGVLSASYPASEPGAAALVRWGDRVLVRKGYGLANLELAVPVAPEHVFEIGSVTKQFTAAAILMLEERGKLAVSDPLEKYLPDFPTHGRTITVEHLLHHTSGIPSYTEMPEWLPRWREDMSLDTLIGLFRGKPLEFPPGERWVYSNSAYVLLGAVIEQASGESYERFVEEEIFARLGMAHSRYGHKEEVVPGRAAGYGQGEGGYANAPYLSMTQPFSAGSLMSTVDDLARWVDGLYGGEVITAASRQRMLIPAALAGGAEAGASTRYGYGLGVSEIAGRAVHEHGGGIHGYACDLLSLPDERLLVVILSNNPTREPGPGFLARRIAAKALGQPFEERPTLILPEASLEDYVGVYRVVESESDRRYVTRDGGKLYLQRTGGSRHEWRAVAPDVFMRAESDATARFVRDAAGRVSAIEVDSVYGPVSRSPRTEEPLPAERQAAAVDPARYDALVGVYELAPGLELAITRDGDRLFAQATGQERAEMFPESENRFFLKVVDAQLEFVCEAGAVTGLVLHQGGRRLPGKRKP